MNLIEKIIAGSCIGLGAGGVFFLGDRVIHTESNIQAATVVPAEKVERLSELDELRRAQMEQLLAQEAIAAQQERRVNAIQTPPTGDSMLRPGVYAMIARDAPPTEDPILPTTAAPLQDSLIQDNPAVQDALNEIEARRVAEEPKEVVQTNTRSFSAKISPIKDTDSFPPELYDAVWKDLAGRNIDFAIFLQDTGLVLNPDNSVSLDGVRLSPTAFQCYVNGYVPNTKYIKPNCGW
jgi:hypothetical protein